MCDSESDSGHRLYLVSDIKNIEVAKGRPFNIVTDSFPDVDPSETVYNIRGSFTFYACNKLGDINGEPGKNCTAEDEPQADGMCYKSTFGDWHCHLSDTRSPSTAVTNWRRYVPPRK